MAVRRAKTWTALVRGVLPDDAPEWQAGAAMNLAAKLDEGPSDAAYAALFRQLNVVLAGVQKTEAADPVMQAQDEVAEQRAKASKRAQAS